ncbi:MAG: hypothetical protein ACK56W_07125 [Pirellula sp.]|jgi:hypothetical protein|nr:hypothetical protein [Pirellula sp.]
MSAATMAATAAAAASIQALKAGGVLVHVDPQEILRVVSKQSEALVVRSTFGILSTHYSYITSYKGLAFYATSPEPLAFPAGTELIDAKSIWVPG